MSERKAKWPHVPPGAPAFIPAGTLGPAEWALLREARNKGARVVPGFGAQGFGAAGFGADDIDACAEVYGDDEGRPVALAVAAPRGALNTALVAAGFVAGLLVAVLLAPALTPAARTPAPLLPELCPLAEGWR